MNTQDLKSQLAHDFEIEKKQAVEDLRLLHELTGKLLAGLEGANPEAAFTVIESELGGFYSPLDRRGLEVRLGALKERARSAVLLEMALANEANSPSETSV